VQTVDSNAIGKNMEECKKFDKYEQEHLRLGMEIIKAYGGAIYPLDLLAIPTLNRSLCLMKGFIELIIKKNFLSAAPLIRLQLDNALRFYAASLVPDPHDFAFNVFRGISVRNQKDKNNKSMTDTYLVNSLTQEYPWVKKVYKNTCGFVHLSEKHIFNAIVEMSDLNEDFGRLNMKISGKDENVNDNMYEEAIEAFKAITDILFRYMEGWIYVKNNPTR